MTWSFSLQRIFLALFLGLGLLGLFATAQSAQAAGPIPVTHTRQSEPPPTEGSGTDFAGRPLVDVLYALATLIVQLVVFGAGAIMAANIARGAFSAQIANLVGSPTGMSQAWMNIIASVITFLFAILSPMLIGIIAEAVRSYVNVSFTLPRF